jgi:nucleotide-binding universal stress UspA family protein
MYGKIVVPLDGSRFGEKVLRYAAPMANAFGARIELLRVIPEELLEFRPERRLRDSWLRYLVEVADRLPQNLDIDYAVEIGKPAQIIIDHGAGGADGLIAMTTHERTGFERWRHASLADRVIKAAVGPVLLLRAESGSQTRTAPELNRLVVPLDGSGAAELALGPAAEVARRMHLKVVLGYVRAVTFSKAYLQIVLRDDADLEKRHAHRYLERKMLELKNHGIERISYEILEGDVATEIMGLAAGASNLIVMTTHGSSGFRRHGLGTIADRVTSHCKNPVLIVRVPEPHD